LSVLGPAPAALPRLVGRWRFQLILRADDAGRLRDGLRRVAPRLQAASRKGVRASWDVDPRNLM
jgi:primosomal protein N'